MNFPELPDFLRIDVVDRRQAWRGKRPRWTSEMTFAVKKKDEDPATRRLRREIEAAAAAKKKAALQRLRENY